jgi:hypothetical protein
MNYLFFIVVFSLAINAQAKGYFAGYDFGEMAFNDFKNFSGEFGYKRENRHMVKLIRMNVVATEAHLSSDFARAVDGDNVAGKIDGYEIFYTLPFNNKWYWGASVGSYKEAFKHTILSEAVSSDSWTLGVSLGYREDNFLGFKRIYYDVSIPVRYSFNGFKETKLGDATVRSNKISNNIWFNIGIYL